jgi:hypothetical protein
VLLEILAAFLEATQKHLWLNRQALEEVLDNTAMRQGR